MTSEEKEDDVVDDDGDLNKLIIIYSFNFANL